VREKAGKKRKEEKRRVGRGEGKCVHECQQPLLGARIHEELP
jgi:hypothetical protein